MSIREIERLLGHSIDDDQLNRHFALQRAGCNETFPPRGSLFNPTPSSQNGADLDDDE